MIKTLFENIKKDNISEWSAVCAYYTILSFIPFIMLVITLIQYTGVSPDVLFEVISNVVPKSMNEMVLDIVYEVYSKSIGTISISIVFTLWSAGKGLFALNKIMNKIYEMERNEEFSYIYLRIKGIFQTILFIFIIVLGLIIVVFGGFLKILILFGLLVIYRVIPAHKVSFKSQFLGAFLGMIAFNLVSYIFSKYLLIFRNFSFIYGSLTSFMLIMMWIYASFYIVFLGAEINKIACFRRKKLLKNISKNTWQVLIKDVRY